MKIYSLRYPDELHESVTPYSLAIGFFDGVHEGHQAVIRQAVNIAQKKGITPAVMTFDPHPSYLFKKEEDRIEYVTPREEKVRLLEKLGVEVLFVVTFDWALASLSPEQFVDVFIRQMNVRHVTAGFDFTFGQKGKGTMDVMKQLAHGDYETTTVEKVTLNGEKVSSTRTRQYIQEGRVEEAAALLGRPYRTIGTVIDGDKRGRTIGFPTANLKVDPLFVQPKQGVYAVYATVGNETYEGVCNVGVVPTFQTTSDVSIEVHLLQFDKSIYGETLYVDWKYRLRDEMKFNGVEELVAQISKDKEKAHQLFKSN